ncbi:unnamed protein product [Cochlearia groenlandica]
MKFFVSLVTFFLLLNVFATGQTLIQDSCKKAAAKDPNMIYGICVRSLQRDPRSKTATSLEGLFLASTMNAATKTANLKRLIQKILNDKKSSHGIELPLRDCVEVFTDAIDSINDALSSIKSSDYETANVNLSAALDAPDTCEDGFKESRQWKSPVTKENNALFQNILIPLAFSNMV